jgi:hypothetical protein
LQVYEQSLPFRVGRRNNDCAAAHQRGRIGVILTDATTGGYRDTGGPTMMARIGVMKALNRHVERVFNPDRKDIRWGKRKLKRDQ